MKHVIFKIEIVICLSIYSLLLFIGKMVIVYVLRKIILFALININAYAFTDLILCRCLNGNFGKGWGNC